MSVIKPCYLSPDLDEFNVNFGLESFKDFPLFLVKNNLASDVSCISVYCHVVKLAICKPSQFCVKWLQIRS